MSSTLSPSNIVLGKGKPDIKDKKIHFGTYIMVYTQTTNDMKIKSVPGIALGASN